MLGLFSGLFGLVNYGEGIAKTPQTLFIVGSVLAILHNTRSWLWARRAVRNIREDTVGLLEVRSGTGEGGEFTWERHLVYDTFHAVLDEPGALVSQEAEEVQNITILRRGVVEVGKPLMIYFENRWQQTRPVGSGGRDVVKAQERY